MISRLEDWFDNIISNNCLDKTLSNKFLNSWEYFDYPNYCTFETDVKLLLETIYQEIKLVKDAKIRLGQDEFRSSLIDYYGSKCVITGNQNLTELEAAHVVEVKFNGDFNISNGLLLSANLHKTFDKYEWTINPKTFQIELANSNNPGSINQYVGKKINFNSDPILWTNLKFRYDKFIELNNL